MLISKYITGTLLVVSLSCSGMVFANNADTKSTVSSTDYEISVRYLEARYGADRANWPYDTKVGEKLEKQEVFDIELPDGHPAKRAEMYMRDRN